MDKNGFKVPTEYGNQIGITVPFPEYDGSEYPENIYSADAQRFIYENIDTIISYNHNGFKNFIDYMKSL